MENGNIKAEPGQGRFLAGQLTPVLHKQHGKR
jgi:hypothetical protein